MSEYDLPFWIAIPASLLLVVGGLLALTGSMGLVRLTSFYQRIHAPTMGNTMGVSCVLVASIMLFSWTQSRPILHEVLIVMLLFLTSPVTAMLLMRAAVYRQRQVGEHDDGRNKS